MTGSGIALTAVAGRFDEWARVVSAVEPRRACTPEEVTAHAAVGPERLYLTATLDGVLAGAGFAEPFPGTPPRPFDHALVHVLPAARRRGVGTALFAAVSDWARARGRTGLEGFVAADDPDGVAYFAARGYQAVERYRELALDLGAVQPAAVAAPAGVEITTYAARPDLLARIYAVDREASGDIPGVEPSFPKPVRAWRERQLEGPGLVPEACFVAVAGAEVIGMAQLRLLAGRPGVARHGLTGVLRAWRGRGVAGALKRAQIAWAKAVGLHTLETANEERNVPMRRLNDRLGYRPLPDRVMLRGPLHRPR